MAARDFGPDNAKAPTRLVALDEGTDIALDRAMVVVGRHPQCDARLDSLRISRYHCCMTQDQGDVVIRDLGSTNGIRINGQRVETGRLRPGDELSIAHIRYRLENGQHVAEKTLAMPHDVSPHDRSYDHENNNALRHDELNGPISPEFLRPIQIESPPLSTPLQEAGSDPDALQDDNPLAAAVRELLPAGVAERCRIQVIVHMPHDANLNVNAGASPRGAENLDACRPDSSH